MSNRGDIDIAFVIDTTGSMRRYMRDLLESSSIERFIAQIEKRGLDYRTAIVSFGDLTVPGDKIEATDFTSDLQEFRRAFERMPQNNGGDNTGESALEALEYAMTLHFRRYAEKVVILITDEPPLESPEHSVVSITAELSRRGIIAFVVAPSLPQYEFMARRSRGAWYSIDSLLEVFIEIAETVWRIVRRRYEDSIERMEAPAAAPASLERAQAPAAAAPPAPPQTITRFPDVSMREKVSLRQRCALRVAITQQPTRVEFEKYRMSIAIPLGAESTTVDVLVTANDFELIGDEFRSLTVPKEGDSSPLIFEMIPQVLGAKKIKAEFFQSHKYIGGVTISIQVVKPGEAAEARQISARGIVGVDRKSIPPDLTILITEGKSDENRWRYKFKLHSPQNGLYFRTVVEELVLMGSPSKWVEGLYSELAVIGQKEGKTNIAETLNAIGVDLYEKLFPREMKEIWDKQLSGNVKSIMIISDEPWIPWELIRPTHRTETGEIVEANFLCQDYQLTRWIAGPPPASKVRIVRGAVIAPLASDLPNVQQELDFLESRIGLLRVAPRLDTIRQLLTYGGVQLLHFACHGSFDPEEHEQSVIYLEENERLNSRDISGMRRNFGRDNPLIFINACQTARADFSLVGIGGWADKFINAQASGFLGSAWEVNDRLAYEFTRAFYLALLQGNTVGEAVQVARLQIKDDQDSTWLAYTVYADPLAKIVFE
jgi:hypothetical protein